MDERHAQRGMTEKRLMCLLRIHFPQLSPRQLEILRELIDGCIEKEIAVKLGIAPDTVHVHMKELYNRVGVRSRNELLGRLILHMVELIPDEVVQRDQRRQNPSVVVTTGSIARNPQSLRQSSSQDGNTASPNA